MRLRTNNRTMIRMGGLVALALFAAACGAPESVPSTTESVTTTDAAAARVPVTADPGRTTVDALPELIDTLAGDLDVATDDVAVVADEEVVWSDGALGCPEPDMAYTDALVPGRRVILESGGLTFTYHSSLEGGFFLCTEPQPPATVTPPTTGAPVTPDEIRTTSDAIDALAARRGVGRDAVTVVLEENVTWSDGSIGCPQPGMSYTQALVDGRRVVLAVDGVKYHYHGAQNGPMFYCADPAAPSAGGGGGLGDT